MTQAKNQPFDSRDSVGPQNADNPYYSYQLDFLLNEIKYLQQSSNDFVWKFLKLRMQELCWTIERLIGQHVKLVRPVPAQERVEMRPGPRVLVDCTETHRNGLNTGIQRVVREVAKASIANGGALPVIIENGRLISYFQHPDLPDVVDIREGDQFLLLDSGWALLDERIPIMQEVSRRGGSNICCIYDLIPLLYPAMFAFEISERFLDWLKTSFPYCDAIVTISKSVAEDFINYVSANELRYKPSLPIGWFHLGADFSVEIDRPVSRQVQNICEKTPFFLTVGTLEPRKNHTAALAAFELLWKAGTDVRYVIVGRFGWLAHALRDRIVRHPEFGRRLFWLEHADDTNLHVLYRHATAVIQPSIAEGFGLPIIEAAHFGAPVIASDIRIFREIGGQSISYFDPMDPNALARCIQEALVSPRVAPSISPLSWTEATERLLNS